VKIGDLVKTTRLSVGIPAGTAGLIIGVKNLKWASDNPFVLDFFKPDQYGLRRYIFFKEDLEVISESW
jgi:hypothetical protein